MFATHALREYNSHVRIYISGVRTYNIDDLYHTGQIDPPSMEKVVYIVCTCMHNDTGSQLYIIVLQSKTAARLGFL